MHLSWLMGLLVRHATLPFALAAVSLTSALMLVAHAQPAMALGKKCGVVRYPLDDLYSNDASVLALRVPCDEGRALAEEWYLRVDLDEIPDKAFAGEHAQYGHDVSVLGFRCRWRRFGSDIGQVRCDASGRRVITWGHHRSAGEDRPRAGYPRIEKPTLSRSEAELEAVDVVTATFGNAFTYADEPSTRCSRVSYRQFRCRIAWFIGDGSYLARVRVVMRRGADGLEHKHARGTARLVDEYCVNVTPRHGCVRTYVLADGDPRR
jgi:hypothetical protein